jgi:hypothetical protein
MLVKTGSRLRSAVSAAEVIVIKAPDRDVALTIGDQPVVHEGDDDVKGVDKDQKTDDVLALGKRYTDPAETIELLCTKAGAGSLAMNGEALFLKTAKPLPSSD